MKTLVLGVGNPILSDDSVGFRVARALEGKFDERQVTVLETSRNWLDVVDLLTGHDKAIIICAMENRLSHPGH